MSQTIQYLMIGCLLFCSGCNQLLNLDNAIQKAIVSDMTAQGIVPDESSSSDLRADYTNENATEPNGALVDIRNQRIGSRLPEFRPPASPPNDLASQVSGSSSESNSAWEKIEQSILSKDAKADLNRQSHRPKARLMENDSILKSLRQRIGGSQFAEKPAPLIMKPSVVTIKDTPEEIPFPFDSDSEITWRDSLGAAINHLRQEIKSGQVDPRQSKHLQKCLKILSLVDHEDQSLVNLLARFRELQDRLPKHHFKALTRVISEVQVDHTDRSELVSLLREAISKVVDSAPLIVKNVEFCKEVIGFGKFKCFDEKEFQAGDEVLVYCELENFAHKIEKSSSVANRDQFQCSFDAQLQFLNQDEEIVHVKSFADIDDRCERARNDFYLFFRIKIPNLKSGQHRLQIRINDNLGRKNAVLITPASFQVVDK